MKKCRSGAARKSWLGASGMRVFKTRTFARWADKDGVSDAALSTGKLYEVDEVDEVENDG